VAIKLPFKHTAEVSNTSHVSHRTAKSNWYQGCDGVLSSEIDFSKRRESLILWRL